MVPEQKSKLIPYAILLGVSAVIISALALYLRGDRPAKHAQPPPRTATVLTPNQAGQIMAVAYNKTPPLTSKITGLGLCIERSPHSYTCAALVHNAQGDHCISIPFYLDVVKRQFHNDGDLTKAPATACGGKG